MINVRNIVKLSLLLNYYNKIFFSCVSIVRYYWWYVVCFDKYFLLLVIGLYVVFVKLVVDLWFFMMFLRWLVDVVGFC